MKLKKILFVSAAVAAMTGVMATGALAADIVAEWDSDTQSVVITDGITDRDVYTVLVLATDEGGLAKTEIVEEDIKQINEQSEKYTEIKVGDLPAGTYEVRVGGDGTLDTGMFTVSGDPDNPYADSTRLLGDVDGANGINVFDATGVISHVAENTVLTGESLQAADTTDDGNVNVFDATDIVNYVVEKSSNVDGSKTIATKTNYVQEVTE